MLVSLHFWSDSSLKSFAFYSGQLYIQNGILVSTWEWRFIAWYFLLPFNFYFKQSDMTMGGNFDTLSHMLQISVHKIILQFNTCIAIYITNERLWSCHDKQQICYDSSKGLLGFKIYIGIYLLTWFLIRIQLSENIFHLFGIFINKQLQT